MNCIIVGDISDGSLPGNFVARCSSLNLIGIYNDPASAVEHLARNQNIDLAFIDIEMTGIENIEIFNNLRCPPYIIAISSDGKDALKAFDHNCVDYLIKPVSFPRFCKAVDKTLTINSRKETSNSEEIVLFIKDNSTLTRLNVEEITYIEALKNNINVNTIDKKYTLYFTLKGFESKLPHGFFTRIHKSFVVNKKLIRMVNGNHLEIEQGAVIKTLPVGRLFRKQILDEMNVINK